MEQRYKPTWFEPSAGLLLSFLAVLSLQWRASPLPKLWSFKCYLRVSNSPAVLHSYGDNISGRILLKSVFRHQPCHLLCMDQGLSFKPTKLQFLHLSSNTDFLRTVLRIKQGMRVKHLPKSRADSKHLINIDCYYGGFNVRQKEGMQRVLCSGVRFSYIIKPNTILCVMQSCVVLGLGFFHLITKRETLSIMWIRTMT